MLGGSLDTIAGYIGTIVVSLIIGYFGQFLRPRSRIVCWSPHNFRFDLKSQNVVLQTNSLTLQNIGREPAEAIEIIHKQKPDFFEIHPPVDYAERINPSGEHVIAINSLGPKEWIFVQILSHTHLPNLQNVRWKHGAAEVIQTQPQRMAARWIVLTRTALVLIGAGTIAYLIVRLALHVARVMGWVAP